MNTNIKTMSFHRIWNDIVKNPELTFLGINTIETKYWDYFTGKRSSSINTILQIIVEFKDEIAKNIDPDQLFDKIKDFLINEVGITGRINYKTITDGNGNEYSANFLIKKLGRNIIAFETKFDQKIHQEKFPEGQIEDCPVDFEIIFPHPIKESNIEEVGANWNRKFPNQLKFLPIVQVQKEGTTEQPKGETPTEATTVVSENNEDGKQTVFTLKRESLQPLIIEDGKSRVRISFLNR